MLLEGRINKAAGVCENIISLETREPWQDSQLSTFLKILWHNQAKQPKSTKNS
jgi:hypothetical protein